jgi:hemoglobin
VPEPTTSLFDRLGGEPAVRKLVDRFYDLMDQDPDVRALRELHPPSLEGSRDKLAWFLTGWLGGPQQYVERFGHPRLRARHLPFAIDAGRVGEWMKCMTRAIEEQVEDASLREALLAPIGRLAEHMKNQI